VGESCTYIAQPAGETATMGEKVLSTAVSEEEIFGFLRQFGRNTNSFLLAYGGCEWFRSDNPSGLVAYVRSGHTCVVAGDPLCASEDTLAVLQAFSRHVGNRYRIALLLVSGWLLPQLKQAGYGAIEVGSDPFFDLKRWAPRGDRAKKVRSSVNLARRSGVTVSVYRPAKGRDPQLELEMEACANAWLTGRQGFTMRFFSAQRPLEWAKEKRFLLAWHERRLVGFVTCSPIYARDGWYIEDIVRRPEATYGTTELLITSALESLCEEGFSMATIGISPFANLSHDPQHPGRMRVICIALAALRPFYNFRGLQHYRKKFAPSWWEPVYVAFWPDRVTPRLVLDAANALIPGGFFRLVRGWIISCVRGILEWPVGASRRIFVFSRVGFYIPLKRRYRLLDSLALGVGLAVAFILASTMYQDVRGSNTILSTMDELPDKLAVLRIVPVISLFLAWRFLAMLARDWQVESIDDRLREDETRR